MYPFRRRLSPSDAMLPPREALSFDPSESIVFYDGDCPLCRDLAAFAARRARGALRFAPWQSFAAVVAPLSSPGAPTVLADRLRFWTGGKLLEGEEAWRALLLSHPDLDALAWLAERLGLARATAQVMQRSGRAIRRLCGRCP